MARVRPYVDADAHACCDVINASITLMDGLNEAARAFVRSKNVPDVLGAELRDAYTLVAENDGAVCGVGCLAGSEMKRLYVAPTAQHLGIGRALVAALEQEARRRGQASLRIEASPASVPFYETVGFDIVREGAFTRGEATFRFVVMKKQLGTPG